MFSPALRRLMGYYRPHLPALLLSVLGQLLVHAGCMFYALSLAKAAMSDAEIREAILLQKKAENGHVTRPRKRGTTRV